MSPSHKCAMTLFDLRTQLYGTPIPTYWKGLKFLAGTLFWLYYLVLPAFSKKNGGILPNVGIQYHVCKNKKRVVILV